MGTPTTIFIEDAYNRLLVREQLAIAAMTPGHLVEKLAAGFQKHSTAAGNAQKLFALENLADAGDIDRAYVAGETSRAGYAQRGDLVYGLIGIVAAIVVGDPLESAGDGTLRKHTPQAVAEGGAASYNIYTDQIVGYASESVDNSGGSGEVRLQVEVA